MATYGSLAEPYILLAIANKLTGRTEEGFSATVLQYDSTEKLLSDIILQYSNIGLADETLSQLKVVAQKLRELAVDFG